MKQIYLWLALSFSCVVFGQITLDHTYQKNRIQTFYSNDGSLIYVAKSDEDVSVEIYSSSHTLLQTVDLKPLLGDSIVTDPYGSRIRYDTLDKPQLLGGTSWFRVSHVSDKLIDGDSGYELMIERNEIDTIGLDENWGEIWHTGGKYSYTSFSALAILDDNGSVVMGKKHADFVEFSDGVVTINDRGQWKFGIEIGSGSLKYKDNVEKVEVYNLPGTSHTVGLLEKESTTIDTKVFPNPAMEYTKVAYELPAGTPSATMIIYNQMGEEVERMDVGTAFDDVLINTSLYNAGTYIYQMESNKQTLSRGKFIVMK